MSSIRAIIVFVLVGATLCAFVACAASLWLYAQRFSDSLAMSGNAEFAYANLHPVRHKILSGAVPVFAVLAVIGLAVAVLLRRLRSKSGRPPL